MREVEIKHAWYGQHEEDQVAFHNNAYKALKIGKVQICHDKVWRHQLVNNQDHHIQSMILNILFERCNHRYGIVGRQRLKKYSLSKVNFQPLTFEK